MSISIFGEIDIRNLKEKRNQAILLSLHVPTLLYYHLYTKRIK